MDYYFRTTSTYEWDTAAGELILSEVGGETLSLPDYRPLRYNKTDLVNSWFFCRARKMPGCRSEAEMMVGGVFCGGLTASRHRGVETEKIETRVI